MSLLSSIRGRLRKIDLWGDSSLDSPLGRTFIGLVYLWPLLAMPIVWNEIGPSSKIGAQGNAILLFITIIVYKGYRAFRSNVGMCLGLFFLLYPIFCYLSLRVAGEMIDVKTGLLITEMRAMILAFLMCVFGFVAGRRLTDLAAIVAFAGMVAYIAYRADTYGSFQARAAFYYARGYAINYQYVGDALVITSLILLSRLQDKILILGICITTMTLLYLVQSGSAMVFGSAALLLALLRSYSIRTMLYAMGALLVIIVVAEAFQGSRLTQLFAGGGTNSSSDARGWLMTLGFRAVQTNPLLGRYQFQYEYTNDAANYVHNILNVYAQSGIVPFLLLAGALFFIGRRLFRQGVRDEKSALKFLPLYAFAILSWVFARYQWSYQIFFIVGFVQASTFEYKRRKKKVTAPDDDSLETG